MGLFVRNLADILDIFKGEHIPDRVAIYLKMKYSCF